MSLTTEQIAKEIERLQELSVVRPEGCFITRELADEMGKSYKTAQILIRRAVEDGLCEFVGKIPVRNMMDGTTQTPAYRWISAKK